MSDRFRFAQRKPLRNIAAQCLRLRLIFVPRINTFCHRHQKASTCQTRIVFACVLFSWIRLKLEAIFGIAQDGWRRLPRKIRIKVATTSTFGTALSSSSTSTVVIHNRRPGRAQSAHSDFFLVRLLLVDPQCQSQICTSRESTPKKPSLGFVPIISCSPELTA